MSKIQDTIKMKDRLNEIDKQYRRKLTKRIAINKNYSTLHFIQLSNIFSSVTDNYMPKRSWKAKPLCMSTSFFLKRIVLIKKRNYYSCKYLNFYVKSMIFFPLIFMPFKKRMFLLWGWWQQALKCRLVFDFWNTHFFTFSSFSSK